MSNYNGATPKLNGHIGEDGKLKTLSGLEVDLETAHKKYKEYTPQVDKYLCPDGTTKTLTEILGGNGEGATPEQIEMINKNSKGVSENSAQLQSCVHKLEDVVNVISPQGIGQILADKAINVGSNVIEGDHCSFIKDGESFYIGKGYTNTHDNTVVYATWSESDLKTTTITDRYLRCDVIGGNVGSKASNYVTTKLNKLTAGKTYIISFEYKRSHDDITALLRFGEHEIPNLYGNIALGDKAGVFKRYNFKITPSSDTGISFYPVNSGIRPINSSWIELKNMQVAEVQNNVPFVSYFFKGGEVAIPESITSETHTIIGVGYKFDQNNPNSTYYICGGAATERAEIDGNFYFPNFIMSKSCKKMFKSDGSSRGITSRGIGISEGKINISNPYYSGRSPLEFKTVVLIEGDLGEEKSLEIMKLLEDGNYILENHLQGTIYPIEGMLKRLDNYGIVKEHIEATVDRDLWYASEEGLYHIINKATLQESYARVNEDLSITGDLEDVSGRLRTLYDCYIRKVS